MALVECQARMAVARVKALGEERREQEVGLREIRRRADAHPIVAPIAGGRPAVLGRLRGVPAGVPLRLTQTDRFSLLRERPAVALLMPAHNEATTVADREALAERIHDTIIRTPSYATLFVLADSPATERANEQGVVVG